MSDGFIEQIKEMKRIFKEHEKADEFMEADSVLLDFAYKYWDWLIKRANKAEELREENDELKEELQKQNDLRLADLERFARRANKLERQNKRYFLILNALRGKSAECIMVGKQLSPHLIVELLHEALKEESE